MPVFGFFGLLVLKLPVVEAHDFNTKLAHAIQFLSEDMKVCVKLGFRGRQRAHKEFGFEVVNRLVRGAAAYGRTDAPPKMQGERDLSVVISPLPRDKRPKSERPLVPHAVETPGREPHPTEVLQLASSHGADSKPA
jgi:translation initiation factor IF-3